VFYGWIVAAAGAVGLVASVPGQTMGVSVFTEPLMGVLGLTRGQLSFAYMAGTLCSGLVLPYATWNYNRFGDRKLAVVSSAALGVALLYMSQVDRLAGAAAGWLGLDPGGAAAIVAVSAGFLLMRFWGQGILTIASRNVMAKWWNRWRGRIIAVAGILVSFSFALAPKVLDDLIQALGWRGAWQAIGLALLAGFSLFAWLLYRDAPEDCGLEMDGGRKAEPRQGDELEFTIHKEFTRREAVRCFAFWAFMGTFALQAAYVTAYTFHVVDIGARMGLERAQILDLFKPIAAAGVATSLAVGWLGDRTRLKFLLAFMAFGMGLAALALAAGEAAWAPWLAAVGLGASGGCFGTLSGQVWPRFFGRRHLGAISGMFMSWTMAASAVGPWLFSLSLAATGSYRAAHLSALVLAGALCVGAFFADNPQRKLAPRSAT